MPQAHPCKTVLDMNRCLPKASPKPWQALWGFAALLPSHAEPAPNWLGRGCTRTAGPTARLSRAGDGRRRQADPNCTQSQRKLTCVYDGSDFDGFKRQLKEDGDFFFRGEILICLTLFVSLLGFTCWSCSLPGCVQLYRGGFANSVRPSDTEPQVEVSFLPRQRLINCCVAQRWQSLLTLS